LGALIVLAVLGGGAIEDFALTMFIGILVGTYSSIIRGCSTDNLHGRSSQKIRLATHRDCTKGKAEKRSQRNSAGRHPSASILMLA